MIVIVSVRAEDAAPGTETERLMLNTSRAVAHDYVSFLADVAHLLLSAREDLEREARASGRTVSGRPVPSVGSVPLHLTEQIPPSVGREASRG